MAPDKVGKPDSGHSSGKRVNRPCAATVCFASFLERGRRITSVADNSSSTLPSLALFIHERDSIGLPHLVKVKLYGTLFPKDLLSCPWRIPRKR
jgi:hypothetical protein